MGILSGVVSYLFGLALNLLDATINGFLGALGFDLDTFEHYFPAAAMYHDVIVGFAVGLLFILLLFQVNNRHYFVRRFQVKIEGEIKKRIQCFWVLLDYMNQVDQHYASGTPSSLISMEIDGRDYSILYAETGKEKLCNYQMERGGVTRYFVVVENLSQIPLIKGEQIHAFVLLDEKNTVHYYSPD